MTTDSDMPTWGCALGCSAAVAVSVLSGVWSWDFADSYAGNWRLVVFVGVWTLSNAVINLVVVGAMVGIVNVVQSLHRKPKGHGADE